MHKSKRWEVLALSDQPNLTKFLARFLKRRCNDRVKTYNSGVDALKRCQKTPPDLVICMWDSVRDMSATEFCRRMRATPGCEDVPIIVSDMRSTPQRRAQLREAGANGYIPAPARPDDVLKAREAVLSGRTYNL